MLVFDLLASEFFILSNRFTHFDTVPLQGCYDIFQVNRMLWKHTQFSNIVGIHGATLFYYSWSNDIVVKALHSQSSDPRFKTNGWF